MRKRFYIFILGSFCLFSSFSQQVINQNLFGFCTSNTFTYIDVYDSSFVKRVNNFSPYVLRFPGGTIGNFYHPQGEAYGFKVSDVEECYSGRFSNRVHTLKRAAKRMGHHTDYLEDFIALAKTFKSNVIVNANILNSDKNEIIYVINRLKQEGVNVLGVELGSELSNRAYKKKIESVYDYILIAKTYSDHIKNLFPDIKVGVVAAPIKENIPDRIQNWNSILAKENFYDAIIHHSYHKVVDGMEDAGVMISEDIVDNSNTELYNLYKQRIIKELIIGFPKRIKQYNNIFNDKEIWITEWNLQMTPTTGNTLFQSLFVAHYMLNLLYDSSLCNINIATYHNLAGRDLSASIFQNKNKNILTHSTYMPFNMISKIFTNNIKKIDKVIIDSNCYVFNCYDSLDNIEMIYFINWSAQEYQIAYEELSLINLSFKKGASHYSNNLFDRPDDDGSFFNAELDAKFYFCKSGDSVIIPAYSVSYIIRD